MSLPATFAAGALYDNLIQAALRRFFDRAVFETRAVPSVSSDGRLAIEPTGDPATLCIRWFGSRHTLAAPPSRPFTAHETRFARAIGAVLAARYRAIFNPKLMAERGDLFRGAIEDRYVGAFLDSVPYTIDTKGSRADRIATAIEVLRVAVLSSYENRPISSGVLLVDADEDPAGRGSPGAGRGPVYGEARNYRAHARATHGNRDVCVVLSPSHEIKIFADGTQVFTFRNAGWHLLDLDPAVFEALASIDGATVVDGAGRLLAAGAILLHPTVPDGPAVEGARTTAALAACRYGPVLKVSEDGVITFFDWEKIWEV